jgi:hypothetical protein
MAIPRMWSSFGTMVHFLGGNRASLAAAGNFARLAALPGERANEVHLLTQVLVTGVESVINLVGGPRLVDQGLRLVHVRKSRFAVAKESNIEACVDQC